MRIKYVVGPFPSRRARDFIAIVDPLGPPKKCPYNCLYCPLGETHYKSIEPVSIVPPKNIVEDYKLFVEEKTSYIKAVLIHGSGDPLLNIFLNNIIKGIKQVNEEYSIDAELWIKTTFHPIIKNNKVLETLDLADKIFVKVDTGSKELYELINDPLEGINLGTLKTLIKDSLKYLGKRKIYIETTIANIDNEGNWSPGYLDEYVAFLNKVSIENIVLTTIVRPPRESMIKPVSNKILKLIYSKLVEQGYNVVLLNDLINIVGRRTINISYIDIYSLLLQRPMTLIELHNSFKVPYRDLAKIIDDLLKNKYIEQLRFRTRIFYRGLYDIARMTKYLILE